MSDDVRKEIDEALAAISAAQDERTRQIVAAALADTKRLMEL